MNSLIDIFIETLWDASIIPYGNQNSFYAITSFNPDASMQAVATATLASAIAYIFNWYVGRWAFNASVKKQTQKTRENYAKAASLAQRYGWIMLLLTFIPFGNYFIMLSGFFKVKLRVVLGVSMPAMAGYYIYQAGLL